MAVIKPYDPAETATAPLPGRSPERLDATASSFGTGNGLEAVGNAVQEDGNTLIKVAEQQEVAQAQVQIAQSRQQMTNYLDQKLHSSAAGDPNFADDFSQVLADHMSEVGGSFATRAGQNTFDVEKARLTGDLLEKAQSYQVTLAGEQAKNSFLTTLDANRSTLVTDPSQFQSILNSNKAMFNDPASAIQQMDPKARMDLQRASNEQLALSAVEGVARVNPSLAKTSIESGQWDQYVSGDARWKLDNIANRLLMAQEVDQNRQLALAAKQQAAAAKQSEDGFVKQLVQDPTKLSAAQIAEDPSMSPEQKLKWIDPTNGILTRALGEKDNTTYGPGFVTALQSLHAPDGTPGKITNDAQLSNMLTPAGQIPGANNITVSGYKELRSELDSRTTQSGRAESDMRAAFLDAAKQQIVGIVPTPQGKTNYDRFVNNFLPAYQAAKDGGASPTSLLSLDGPQSMAPLIKQFTRSPNQQLLDAHNASTAPVVPVVGSPTAATINTAPPTGAPQSAPVIPPMAASELTLPLDKGPGQKVPAPPASGIEMPSPAPAGARTATGPGGEKIYEQSPGVWVDKYGAKVK